MINKNTIIRIARPTNDLNRMSQMYKDGLGFEILSEFKDHDGFDGIILGIPESMYHLEFTQNQKIKVVKAPTEENLLVFYISDQREYEHICRNMKDSGFNKVDSLNPYWDRSGSSYEDPDGYRIVIQNDIWDK